MIKTYLKVAFRSLWTSKGFSALNIAGLALGMTCSLLIWLWVRDEMGMDAFHQKGKQLFSVYDRRIHDGRADGMYAMPGLLADELKKTVPEVEMATGYWYTSPHTFAVRDKIIKEESNNAGEDFFGMFSYPLLEGNATDALHGPESMAISRKMADEFFGSPAAAIGKTVRYENKKDFKVTAVFENLPANVSDRFNCVINWEQFKEENSWSKDWNNNGPPTFALLRPDADPAQVEKKITRFLDKYQMKQQNGNRQELGLQPYNEVYLHSEFDGGKPGGGRIEYVHLFSLIALFILLIACINFMNLTTARSVKRAKEIGVRKVMGAGRFILIRQFMGEAVTVALLSAVLALLLVLLTLPAFNHLTGKEIAFPFAQGSFWAGVAILVFLTGLFSGSYPALFLSSFNPIRVLKGALKSGPAVVWFRKGLVVFQFALSIILIISTILISRQINFIQKANLGYDRENLIYIPNEGDLSTKLDVFKSEALRMPGIKDVSAVTQEPTNINNRTGDVVWTGKDPNADPLFVQAAVGTDFMRTMNLKMVMGRDFSKNFATDSLGYIINESALAIIGYKDPIGKPLSFWKKQGTIIGVVKDFHFASLHDPIEPIVIRQGNGFLNTILIRTEPGQTKQALASLSALCKALNPQFPFTYQFSDEEYTKLYKSESIIGTLSAVFAILAIVISCLGLLGLSVFTAEQRMKEISIRKVLGASVGSLFHLLSWEFLLLVGIAFGIAAPLAWWFMHHWLQSYAYRTDISLWIFGLSGALAMLIALVTVCFQTLRAAWASPISSLKSE